MGNDFLWKYWTHKPSSFHQTIKTFYCLWYRNWLHSYVAMKIYTHTYALKTMKQFSVKVFQKWRMFGSFIKALDMKFKSWWNYRILRMKLTKNGMTESKISSALWDSSRELSDFVQLKVLESILMWVFFCIFVKLAWILKGWQTEKEEGFYFTICQAAKCIILQNLYTEPTLCFILLFFLFCFV